MKEMNPQSGGSWIRDEKTGDLKPAANKAEAISVEKEPSASGGKAKQESKTASAAVPAASKE